MMRLTYLDSKGIAEPIRLALSLAGAEYEDRRVSYEEIKELRVSGKLPFGQVPILEYSSCTGSDNRDNVVVVSQSNAILRFIGRHYGMQGPHGEEEFQIFIDIALAALTEIQTALIPAWYGHACGRNPYTGGFFEKTKLTTNQQAGVLQALNEHILPARFIALNKLYETHEAKYHCIAQGCQEMNIADILLYSLLNQMADAVEPFCEGISKNTVDIILAKCPTIRTLLDSMNACTRVQTYKEQRKG
jgi:glutathione S-transferase